MTTSENIDPFAPITGKEMGNLGKDDWVYRDISWTSQKNWDQIMDVLGNDNVCILAATKQGMPNTITEKNEFMVKRVGMVRGQVLISPTGFENLKQFIKENKNK